MRRISSSFRGILLSSLYVGVVTLPAAVAVVVDPFSTPRPFIVEMSVALGLLAFPLIAMQFALVSRLRAASTPFGTDAMVQWHQYAGLLGLALVLAHPLLLNIQELTWRAWDPFFGSAVTQTGVVATIAIVLVAMTTLWRARLGLSYEAWRTIHLALAGVAAVAMTLHAVAAGGYSRVSVLRWIFVGYAVASAAIAAHYRVIRPLLLRRRPWEIAGNSDEGGSIRTLRLVPLGHEGFVFAPGQFAWLITGSSPWSSQQHPLSISSSAFRNPRGEIEFSIKALGDWSSTVVPRLHPGTRVWVDGPFGAFTIDRAPRAPGVVLIAGGIGIAPLRSMLLTMRDRHDPRPAVLIFAAHDESRLAFVDELRALTAAMHLEVTYVLEEPRGQLETQGGDEARPCSVEAGRLSAALLERLLPPPRRTHAFFVCGPPAMTEDVERTLLRMGIPGRSIDTERFSVV